MLVLWRLLQRKLVRGEENIPNIRHPLVIKQRKFTEDKENNIKGRKIALFLCVNRKYRENKDMNDFLDNLANDQHQKMLREISNDAITPKKSDRKVQNDLYEKKIDDDFYEGLDYDDEMVPSAEF